MKPIIKPEDKAPAFSVKDIWGKEVTVPSKGRWTYLSFHRFAACPFCNLRTNELIRAYPEFERQNIEVISLWPSSADFLLKYVGDQKSPFPIVSDMEKEIYTSYGVTNSSIKGVLGVMLEPGLMFKAIKNKHKKIEVDAGLALLPASFLIDPQGKIKMAYYGKHIGDHPKLEAVFSTIKA